MAHRRSTDAQKEYKEIKAKQQELLNLYQKYFPKVDHGLLQDIIFNTPSSKENDGNMYEIQLITKKGTDPEKMRSFFLSRTGRVPSFPFEDGTHYIVHIYATLDMLKEIQNMDETEHIMGDYTFGAYAFSQRHMHRGKDQRRRIRDKMTT